MTLNKPILYFNSKLRTSSIYTLFISIYKYFITIYLVIIILTIFHNHFFHCPMYN